MPNPKKVLESAKRAEVKLRALAKAKVRVHAAAVRRLAKAREQAERAAMRGSRKAITRERRLVAADFQAFKTATPTEKARVKRTIESQIGRLRKIEHKIELPDYGSGLPLGLYGLAKMAEHHGTGMRHRLTSSKKVRQISPKKKRAATKKTGSKKPPSPAQLAARAKFVAMVRAKAAKKGK